MLLGAMRKIDTGIDETLQTSSELSSSEFAVLVALSEAPERELRLRAMGLQLGWDRSRVSHLITRMEKRGLVNKHRCGSDGRGTIVSLSRSGMRRLKAAAPLHVESVRSLVFDHLDDQDHEPLRRFLEGVMTSQVGEPDEEKLCGK